MLRIVRKKTSKVLFGCISWCDITWLWSRYVNTSRNSPSKSKL